MMRYRCRTLHVFASLSVGLVLLAGCSSQTPEAQHTTASSDSAFKHLLGKKLITHQGPADILGDTTTHAARDSALTGQGKPVKIP